MKERKGHKGERNKQTKAQRAMKRPAVPPPESELWPQECRGKRWKRAFAILFAGRCQLCQYSCPQPLSRRLVDKWAGLTTRLLCMNGPSSPGELREVLPTDTCRNFKQKRWLRPRSKQAKNVPASTIREPDGEVCRIPLGHDRFAIVDAADYEDLSKYRWCASCMNGRAYAVRRTEKGRTVYMHRQIMHAPKGSIVDHIDHNILNNRRCNLRVCTPEQNYANAGPRGGSSGFVGVWRHRKKWVAGIHWQGKHLHLGTFDDPVEAAKARDRKAYELHGPYAYLNFPGDFGR
jgi:hypothetical protein